MPGTKRSNAPHFVNGRKGHTSIVDCIARALWRNQGSENWPEHTFEELRDTVSKMQGYEVSSSTIRSSVYQYPNVFERVKSDGGVLRWRLTKQGRSGHMR